MNVSFVNNQYHLGGAETVVHQLWNGLNLLGHKTSLYVADGKSYPANVTPFYPRLLSKLYHSRFQRLTEFFFPRFALTNKNFRKIAEGSSDLVHLHNFHGNYATVSSLAHVATRKKFVWTFHAFWGVTGGCDHPKNCLRYQDCCGHCPQVGQWPIGPIDITAEQLQLKLKLLSNLKLNIIAPSKHLGKKVQESQLGKNWNVFHIPNGVDPSQFSFARKHDSTFRASLGLQEKTIVILVANRNFKDTQKGFSMAQEALSNLNAHNVEIIFAGEDSDWAAQQIKGSVKILSVGYVTSRKKMADLYEAADIFLFASPAENFPCVILEAMSAKCCIVSTPTSGVTEQIEHGETGFLARDVTGESLAQTLNEALANSSLKEFGERARRRIEKEFSEDQMVRRHLQLYQEIINN